jgi:predicted outer membrane repeat protein
VTNLLDSGAGSLRQAIIDTPSGGTVDFQAGLTGTITLTSGELAIGEDLTIAGPGADVITVSGNHGSRIFEVSNRSATVMLFGLAITQGQVTTNGGGIYNTGALMVSACTLSGNACAYQNVKGGGIYSSGTLTVSGCTFTGNSADDKGGYGGDGGGIYNDNGRLTVCNCILSGNSAANLTHTLTSNSEGGGIYNSGTLTMSGCTLSRNSATNPMGDGGGIYNANSGTLDISNSTFRDNSATGGGAILNDHGLMNVSHCTLGGNSALQTSGNARGAGIYNFFGTATVSDCNLIGNSATIGTGEGSGGAIENDGTLTLTNCILSGNSANSTTEGLGGAIYNGAGTLMVSNCTFTGNSATSQGGGILSVGAMAQVSITNSTFSGNSAGTVGGGIANGGPLILSNCTLTGNSANHGGGIYNSAGTLTVSESTLAANSASRGGAIDNSFLGTVTLTSSTISGNSAGQGAGISNNSGTVTAKNVIVAGNAAPVSPDLAGPLNSLGNNLIGDGSDSSGFIGTDLVGTAGNPIDPLLGPLQDNGGPTQTMALLTGSPAIDAGDNTGAPDTDQRGFPRIVGGTIDIGALEVQPAGQPTHLTFQGPASVTAGTPFAITVTVLDDFGQPVTGYTGTVHFTLTGPVMAMADHTFIAGDMGQHAFTGLVLPRAGAYTVAAADTANVLVNDSTAFTITPAAADHIIFTVPTSITAGAPFALTVTVQDAYGNTVTDYQGTVHFTLTGPAMAQANFTFTTADMGSHTFKNLMLGQAGDYTLTGMDTLDPTLSGSTPFTVST